VEQKGTPHVDVQVGPKGDGSRERMAPGSALVGTYPMLVRWSGLSPVCGSRVIPLVSIYPPTFRRGGSLCYVRWWGVAPGLVFSGLCALVALYPGPLRPYPTPPHGQGRNGKDSGVLSALVCMCPRPGGVSGACADWLLPPKTGSTPRRQGSGKPSAG
jgi:hypothetical protein